MQRTFPKKVSLLRHICANICFILQAPACWKLRKHILNMPWIQTSKFDYLKFGSHTLRQKYAWWLSSSSLDDCLHGNIHETAQNSYGSQPALIEIQLALTFPPWNVSCHEDDKQTSLFQKEDLRNILNGTWEAFTAKASPYFRRPVQRRPLHPYAEFHVPHE